MTLTRFAVSIALIFGTWEAWAQEGVLSHHLENGVQEPIYNGDTGATSLVPPSTSPYMSPGIPQAVQAGNGLDYPQPPVAISPYQRTRFPAAATEERFVESSWYTREEYFHWSERYGGADFVNEYGLLLTVGYVKQIGPERFRAELFGGSMNYVGGAQFEDGSSEPLWSTTGYLGVRGEYDLVFEPDWWPRTSFFLGLGTRFWFRDLRDGMTPSEIPVSGYQEMWWTIYPYLGVETRRVPGGGPEFYSSARIGCTVVTYEHVTWLDAVLYPKPGLTGQAEIGFRTDHFFCAAFSEAMTWRQSAVSRGALQPDSSFATVGVKAGLSF